MKILVTGGAGYIGSRTTGVLVSEGHEVVVIDNLSTGKRERVGTSASLIRLDLSNRPGLRDGMRYLRPDLVLHLAASIRADESVLKPLEYYRNNVVNAVNLLDAMLEAGVKRLVFASSAAVYGDCWEMPIAESAPLSPLNPYGATKMMVERMIEDMAVADPAFKYVVLRYFNVAGDSPSASSALIPRAVRAAMSGDKVLVNGDGSSTRDFVHVEDVALANAIAIKHLSDGGSSAIMNCGTGVGTSVFQVLQAVARITGRPVNCEMVEAVTEISMSVASNDKLVAAGWAPRFAHIDDIVRSAWDEMKK